MIASGRDRWAKKLTTRSTSSSAAPAVDAMIGRSDRAIRSSSGQSVNEQLATFSTSMPWDSIRSTER
jgi:pyocin large subunit-like protein